MKMMAKLFAEEEISDNTKFFEKNNVSKNSQSFFNTDNIKGDPDVTETIKAVIKIEEINAIGKCQDSSNLFEAKL